MRVTLSSPKTQEFRFSMEYLQSILSEDSAHYILYCLIFSKYVWASQTKLVSERASDVQKKEKYYIYMFVCMYLYIYIYIYMCVCVCVCVYVRGLGWRKESVWFCVCASHC